MAYIKLYKQDLGLVFNFTNYFLTMYQVLLFFYPWLYKYKWLYFQCNQKKLVMQV